jgi:hypothetical protein
VAVPLGAGLGDLAGGHLECGEQHGGAVLDTRLLTYRSPLRGGPGRHPDIEDGGRMFDASPEELKGLKPLDNIVQIEMKSPKGTTAELLMTREDFEAIVSLNKLKGLPGTRGRRPGFRPGNGN